MRMVMNVPVYVVDARLGQNTGEVRENQLHPPIFKAQERLLENFIEAAVRAQDGQGDFFIDSAP